MKISPAAADRFVAKPPAGLRACLVYGPDSGLVRERAAALARSRVADLADPFRVGLLSGAMLAERPDLLGDEAAALSPTGESRVVCVDAAGDRVAAAVETLLARPEAETLVVIEAGELTPRSLLRRLFERARDAAALPCYADDPGRLDALIRAELDAEGLSATEDALRFLCGRLGADRMITRSEIEKLVLYAGGSGRITLEEAVASCGAAAALTLDDLCNAAAAGDATALAAALDRLTGEGVAPVTVLRAVQRYFQRLEESLARISAGAAPDQAIKALRPPLFFKRAPVFRAALGRWTPRAAAAALDTLTAAEITCKSGTAPPEPVAAQALFAIAGDHATRGR